MSKPHLVRSASLASLLLPALVSAQDQQPAWPQWRGPDLDGISKETRWNAEGEGKVLWTKAVGMGYSTVSIADGRLFTIGHDKDAQQDTVYCLDAQTGKQHWSHEFASKTMAKAHKGGSLTTPSIDGELVYVLNREGHYFCFTADKGKLKWKKNMVKEHGAKVPTWGFAASPLILEDLVVVNVGPVVAYTKKGRVKWKSKDYGHAYSTPAVFEHGGKRRFAVFNGDGLVILDPRNGKEIAHSAWKTRYDVNAATPVVIGDKIFISSGYNRGCSMLRFDGKKLETLWENREMRNHMSGCVHYKGHLYGFDETIFKCLALDGEVAWSKRGLGKGAMVLAGDKLLMLTRRGDLAIAAASPEGYKELSRTRVLNDGAVQWTTPVLCGGLVYCRSSMGQLVCIDRRAKAQ